jgi:pyroglutamyl-peptidase
MQRVVVTGFEPYWNYEYNSSWEAAKQVASLDGLNVDIIAEQLPVSFKRAPEFIQQVVKEHKPDLLLMLGQSGGSDRIKLERTALNLMDSKLADNDGYIPDEEPIDTSLPPALFTSLSLKVLKQNIEKSGIPVKISNSCGLYVCNRLYYEALMQVNKDNNLSAIFVHLPLYEGQKGAKPGKPAMPLSQMTDALKTIIENYNDKERRIQEKISQGI